MDRQYKFANPMCAILSRNKCAIYGRKQQTLVLTVPHAAYAHTINPDGTFCADNEYWMPAQPGYYTTPTEMNPTFAAQTLSYSTDERFHNMMNQQLWIEVVPSACIPCPNPLVKWGFLTAGLLLTVLSRGAAVRGSGTASAYLQAGSYTSLGTSATWQLKTLMVDC